MQKFRAFEQIFGAAGWMELPGHLNFVYVGIYYRTTQSSPIQNGLFDIFFRFLGASG
jgi:hypothetical protein